MSRYYDYTNGISWQNQQMAGSQGVGAGKEGGRPQPPMYSPHPAYTSAAQDSRVNLPIAPRNNLYAQSMYHQYQQQAAKPQAAPIPSYPVLPDVKLKRLPFYDNLGEVMKPSSLLPTTTQRIQESLFTFYLSPQQATSVATGRDYVGVSNKLDNIVQVQLRFCLVETTSEQEDHFPPSCGVKINGKICPLPSPIPTNKPGVEPKRPPRPVNITALLKLCPTVANTMTVSWATDFTKNYALNVTLVRKLTSAELLSRLKSKGTKPSDFTRSLIKEKLREDLDSEIATTSLRVSLVCPLGKMRMSCPCRPVTCGHLQCFDGSLFLQMNERKPTWLCPVCDKPAVYDSLVVDGYFQEVLNSPRLGADCCEVQLHKDGSWSAHIPKKEIDSIMTPVKDVKSKVEEVITDDLDVIPLSDGSNSSGGPVAKRSASPASPSAATPSDANAAPNAGNQSVVDLTSDDDDDMPLRKKNYPESQHVEHAKYNDVSSSGYTSPSPPAAPAPPAAIISLDSPSPPPAPTSPPSLPLPLPAHQASVARPSLWTPPPPPLQHRY